MLEQRRDRTDIHELALETPTPSSSVLRDRYEELAQLPYFQKASKELGNDLWPNGLSRNALGWHIATSEVELLRVLVLSEIDCDTARAHMQHIMHTRLHKKGVWYERIKSGGVTTGVRSRDALLAVYILQRFDGVAAKEALHTLQGSLLYDGIAGMYRGSMELGMQRPDEHFPTAAQCLAALSGGTPREALADLRARAYDETSGQWLSSIPRNAEERIKLEKEPRNLSDQLYPILLESKTDPASASGAWARLRASAFFDEAAGRWRNMIDTGGRSALMFSTALQLLAAYVEEQIMRPRDEKEPFLADIPRILTLR